MLSASVAALPLTHSWSYSEFKYHPYQEVLTSASTVNRRKTFHPYLALSFPEASLIASQRRVSCSSWKKFQGTLHYLAPLEGQAPLWNILTLKGRWATIRSALILKSPPKHIDICHDSEPPQVLQARYTAAPSGQTRNPDTPRAGAGQGRTGL